MQRTDPLQPARPFILLTTEVNPTMIELRLAPVKIDQPEPTLAGALQT